MSDATRRPLPTVVIDGAAVTTSGERAGTVPGTVKETAAAPLVTGKVPRSIWPVGVWA